MRKSRFSVEEENNSLKKLLAERDLEVSALKDVIRKNFSGISMKQG